MKKINGFLLVLLCSFMCLNAMLPPGESGSGRLGDDSSLVANDAPTDLVAPDTRVNVDQIFRNYLQKAELRLNSVEQRRNFLQRGWDKLSTRTKELLSLLGIGSGLSLIEVYYQLTGDLLVATIFGGAAGLKVADITQSYSMKKKMTLSLLAWTCGGVLYWVRICDLETIGVFLVTYMANTIYRYVSKKTHVADHYVDELRGNLSPEVLEMAGDELV